MSKGKLLAVSMVWLMMLAVGVVAWKLVFAPAAGLTKEDIARREAQQREQELSRGGTDSRYRTRVNLALDGFSGYAVLRSDRFANELAKEGIKLNLVDDGADYPKRLASLRSGETDMAVFTIDALIKTSAELRSLPATIIAVIDETVGADAIVAYKEAFPNVDSLNSPDARFVLTPDSPSETLARVVMSRFQLDALVDDPFIPAKDASDVFKRYQNARPGDKQVYVAWEPVVTQMLKNQRMHVLVDSSRFPSAIVDVLAVSDDFIAKNREAVLQIVRAYFTANYEYRTQAARTELVSRDAASGGAPLTKEEATRLVQGIWWKNTQENLSHFGVRSSAGTPHLEDMIGGIARVLVDTGSIPTDPTEGHPNYLYNDSVMRALADFHPGSDAETIRTNKMPALSDSEWESLVEVGTARTPSLVFARGAARLTERSRRILDELADTLQTTRYYVIVRGNASRQGDLEANTKLAADRANEVERYLVANGVSRDRIRAIGVQPSGSTSVSFVLGEPPY